MGGFDKRGHGVLKRNQERALRGVFWVFIEEMRETTGKIEREGIDSDYYSKRAYFI